ncbi:MAG: trypsin-like serine peptidase [Panacagrimonas sp.]
MKQIATALCLMLVCATSAATDCPIGSEPTPGEPGDAPRGEHDLRFVIDGSDPRHRAFDNVGAIYVSALSSRGELRKTGSGTLIDACHVLTAYHVVFPEVDLVHARKGVFEFDPQRVVRFRFGGGDKTAEFAHSIEGRPVDLGIFDPYARNYADELILVRLNTSAPADYKPLPLDGDSDYVPGKPDFIVAGFPLDGLSRAGSYRLFGDRCAIMGPDRISGYATNCSLTDGVSGGALFRFREDADCRAPIELQLAGVANQKDGPDLFPKDHPTRRSYVVPIARNRGVIERALAKDPCVPSPP